MPRMQYESKVRQRVSRVHRNQYRATALKPRFENRHLRTMNRRAPRQLPEAELSRLLWAMAKTTRQLQKLVHASTKATQRIPHRAKRRAARAATLPLQTVRPSSRRNISMARECVRI